MFWRFIHCRCTSPMESADRGSRRFSRRLSKVTLALFAIALLSNASVGRAGVSTSTVPGETESLRDEVLPAALSDGNDPSSETWIPYWTPLDRAAYHDTVVNLNAAEPAAPSAPLLIALPSAASSGAWGLGAALIILQIQRLRQRARYRRAV